MDRETRLLLVGKLIGSFEVLRSYSMHCVSRVGALSDGEYCVDEVVDRLVVGRRCREFVGFQLVYR